MDLHCEFGGLVLLFCCLLLEFLEPSRLLEFGLRSPLFFDRIHLISLTFSHFHFISLFTFATFSELFRRGAYL